MKRSLSVLLSLLLAVALGALPATGGDGDPGPGCTVDWTAARRVATPGFGGHVTNLRAGRHECYDRLVVDVSGSAGGYWVGYVDEVRTGGLGAVVPLRGGAKLLVIARAPAHEGATPTYDPADPDEAVDVAAFRSLEQVAFAGSFEGQTTIGLGLRERLPFRVLALPGPGAGSRLVVDVAHAWTGTDPAFPQPLGNFERATGVSGGVEVAGWAIDPDTVDPIYVWVTVDGVGRHLYANRNRPDVGAAYPGYGSSHGFLGTVAAAPGARTVCVTASNDGPGSHTGLGCRVVTVPSSSPVGNFERAAGVPGGIDVAGWAIDPDTADPIYVWVTVDGVGRHLLANGDRPDVGAAFPVFGPAHGFAGTLGASPGRHTVCVTASNVGPGSHRSLGCREVSVPDQSPVGNLERVRGTLDGIEVVGWTIDPDTADPIYVWVTIDGVGRHLLANGDRPDVGAAFPPFGPAHGFSSLVAAAPGRHEVCVTASNVALGAHRLLGCRTVGVFEQPVVWPGAHEVFGTPEAAAADFVRDALGVPPELGAFRQGDARSGEIDVEFSAGGPVLTSSTLAMRQLGAGDGWFVLAGVSDAVTITTPGAGAVVPAGPLTVEGLGRGFEGLVVVEAFRPGETSLLDQETAIAGAFGTSEPYSVTLDLSGARPGDVVTILARGGVGHEDDPGSFSAIPVVIAD